MGLSNKVIRCHILDRKDQLENALWFREKGLSEIAALEKAIETAQTKLNAHMIRLESNKYLIDTLESLQHLDWIDNPPF